MIRAVRGATTLPDDQLETYTRELTRLMVELLERNDIPKADPAEVILTLFLTVTSDLQAISPARIIREAFGWQWVPLFCAQEPVVEGLPERCIRVLVQFYTHRSPQEVCHVYHNCAAALRPDLGSPPS